MLRRTNPIHAAFSTATIAKQVISSSAFLLSKKKSPTTKSLSEQQQENVVNYFKNIKIENFNLNNNMISSFADNNKITTESLQKLMKEKGFLLKNENNNKGNNNNNKNDDNNNNKNDENENNNNNNNNNGEGEGEGEGKENATNDMVQRFLRSVTYGVAATTVIAFFAWYMSYPSGKHVSWKELHPLIDKLESINVYNEYAQVTLEDEKAYVGVRPHMTAQTDQEVRELIAKRDKESDMVQVNFVGTTYGQRFLHFIEVWSFVAPFVFFPLFTLVVSRAAASIVYDNAKLSSAMGSRREQILTQAGEQFQIAPKTTTRFRDIAGMTEAKSEIVEIVDFLKFPDKFTKMGAKIPAGALLLGPPGTGKTMLARAVAGESKTPFIATCGSDFVELYAGMGALRVRKLFELARTQKKCIIYIDEIDAIGSKRTGSGMGEQSEQEHTLNELLTQLDGFNKEKDRIIILASTNAEKDQLDSALTRPGRFDRMVNVESPVLKERVELFETYLKGIRLMKQEGDNDVVGEQPTAVEENNNNSNQDSSSSSSGKTDNNNEKKDETTTTAKSTSEEQQQQNQSKTTVVVEPTIVEPVLEPVTNTTATSAAPVVKATSTTTPVATSDNTTPEQPKKEETPVASTSSTSEKIIEQQEQQEPIVTQATGGDNNSSKKTSSKDNNNDEEDQDDDDKSRNKKFPNKATPEFLALVAQYASRMADLCPGFVGADIASVCNEAAILAAREKSDIVSLDHLERSVDRVLAGIEQRSRVLSDFEKKVVAHHEAGHAVAGWFLGRADPLMKVSIVPRGGKALGYAQYLPNENQLKTSAEIEDSICVTLGGRVAEKIFFDHLSTGASDDLQKIRRMAYMHAATFNRSTAVVSPGTSQTRYTKPYGEATEESIDLAAKQLVDRLYQRTYDLLLKHKGLMEQLAEHLLKHEVLTHTDILHYMGPRMKRPSDHGKVF